MDTTDVEQIVFAAAANRSGIDAGKISADSRFREDMGFDSLAEVEFVIEMEDEFEVEIGYQDAESVSTVGQAIELIQQKIESGEGRTEPAGGGKARPVACTTCSWRGERIYAQPKRCPACGGFVHFR